jgi:RNA polymerase sigma-70 factor, ECF subfamily
MALAVMANRQRTRAQEQTPARERPTAAQLFRDRASFVWRVIASNGVATADVPDLTQEVFLIAHRKIDELDLAEGAEVGWLYAIAIRVTANHRRRAHVRRESGDPIPDRAIDHDPGERIDRERQLRRLDAALDAIDAPKREVFILFEVAQFSMQEIAQMLRCPLKTAYKRLYSARREVSEQLGIQWGEP